MEDKFQEQKKKILKSYKNTGILKKDLEKIIDISLSLSYTENFNNLLSKIIFEARKITNCDAGSIYLKIDSKLKFLITQSHILTKKLGKKGVEKIFKPFDLPIDKNSVAGYCALTHEILNIPNIQIKRKNIHLSTMITGIENMVIKQYPCLPFLWLYIQVN